MINLFVTYRCNLSCSYCFAKDLQADFPEDMSLKRFERLLDWMRPAPPSAVGLIGGEPTLHPHLVAMLARLAEENIPAVIFTNGLFPEGLAERLAPLAANFVVNANDPAAYPPALATRLAANLERLRDLEANLVFSKNFHKGGLDYGYLLEALDRYGARAVRYDISRPSGSGKNEHFTQEDTREIMAHVAGFVKACEEKGVRTGLDCSVRLCDLRDDDRRYLERASMKFSGVCHPSMDIHPDLSASYCLPMRDVRVPDVTAFANQEALMWHFAKLARPIRQANVGADCLECKDFMRRCQGGCMALRRASARGADRAGQASDMLEAQGS